MDAGEAGISAMALDSLIAAVEKNDKQGIRDAVPAVFGAIGADANFELLRINMDYLLYKLVRLACERTARSIKRSCSSTCKRIYCTTAGSFRANLSG